METVSQTEPRSESIPENLEQKLSAYEQKIAKLETDRLEALDRAIILEKQVGNLESKVSSLQTENQEALAVSESRRVNGEEMSSRLGYFETSSQVKDAMIVDLNNS